jgi:hypothetical protein
MGFIAKDSGGGNFKRVPSGAYIGRCYSLIDLGTQLTSGQYGDKLQHKLRIGWELFGEDEQGNPLTVNMDGKTMPMTISKSYTVSLHEKAGLRRDLVAWRGKDFTNEELNGFELKNVLGQWAMISVVETENNGQTYTNIANINPVPASIKKNGLPEAHNETKIFDINDPDMDLFESFSENLQNKIKKSPEWERLHGSSPSSTGADFSDMESDIPF